MRSLIICPVGAHSLNTILFDVAGKIVPAISYSANEKKRYRVVSMHICQEPRDVQASF